MGENGTSNRKPLNPPDIDYTCTLHYLFIDVFQVAPDLTFLDFVVIDHLILNEVSLAW